ncbi:MAG: hypothetical protein R3C61_01030 [Bacteroidia bacterium]
MKNIEWIIVVVSLLALGSGCSPVYGPAIMGNNFPHQARAIYKDSTVKQTWVSGSVHNGMEYQSNEESFLLQAQIHQAYSSQNFRATYGGFIYGGNYDMQRIQPESLNYFGAGLRGSACVALGKRRFEYHLVGLQAGWATEVGAFNRWKEEQAQLGQIVNINDNNFAIPTMNFFTGFEMKSPDYQRSWGLEMAIGSNGIPFTFHYTTRRINAWLQLNMGLIDEENNPQELPPAGFGIGFRL